MTIPFDSAVGYLCINGVATPVPVQDLYNQAQASHATYYNGPANVTQDEMNAWCVHPTHDGIVSEKQPPLPTPTQLPVAGVSTFQIVVVILIVIGLVAIFRNRR